MTVYAPLFLFETVNLPAVSIPVYSYINVPKAKTIAFYFFCKKYKSRACTEYRFFLLIKFFKRRHEIVFLQKFVNRCAFATGYNKPVHRIKLLWKLDFHCHGAAFFYCTYMFPESALQRKHPYYCIFHQYPGPIYAMFFQCFHCHHF